MVGEFGIPSCVLTRQYTCFPWHREENKRIFTLNGDQFDCQHHAIKKVSDKFLISILIEFAAKLGKILNAFRSDDKKNHAVVFNFILIANYH